MNKEIIRDSHDFASLDILIFEIEVLIYDSNSLKLEDKWTKYSMWIIADFLSCFNVLNNYLASEIVDPLNFLLYTSLYGKISSIYVYVYACVYVSLLW